jgi:hypothetical protein
MYILARMAQEFKWVERRDSKVDWEPIIGLATLNRLGTKVALAKAWKAEWMRVEEKG